MGRDIARLVGLDRADEMPHQLLALQRRYLVQGLLQIVLAEVPLPLVSQTGHFIRCAGLAHRQQLHTVAGATGLLTKCIYLRINLRQWAFGVCHY